MPDTGRKFSIYEWTAALLFATALVLFPALLNCGNPHPVQSCSGQCRADAQSCYNNVILLNQFPTRAEPQVDTAEQRGTIYLMTFFWCESQRNTCLNSCLDAR